jgi:NAD-dependent DNA ligase
MQKFLEYASEQYYRGTPIISDEEFDRLAETCNFNRVGARTVDTDVHHLYPMLSLQKCFDLNESPFPLSGAVSTPKLDGAAVSLMYSQGVLRLAITRGDGKKGKNITSKMRDLVPNKISDTRTIQVTGEVAAPSTIPNARNYAAGALNLKDVTQFASRDLTFLAYECTPNKFETYVEELNYLDSLGFNTVLTTNTEKFPTDGIVVRVPTYSAYKELGETSHHPRGAFALKERKDGVVTTLKDVVWQVGKSGVVSPVAILEPILVGDALVSKATLHNIEYIEGLGLEIGCRVEVIRAGEIIPRIVRRV